jgi:hypothetical protein
MQLPLSNIINISVLEAQAGVGDYNTSNLAVFTDETPANTFGTDGFKQYIDPTDVATDFGTSSKPIKWLCRFSRSNRIFWPEAVNWL